MDSLSSVKVRVREYEIECESAENLSDIFQSVGAYGNAGEAFQKFYYDQNNDKTDHLPQIKNKLNDTSEETESTIEHETLPKVSEYKRFRYCKDSHGPEESKINVIEFPPVKQPATILPLSSESESDESPTSPLDPQALAERRKILLNGIVAAEIKKQAALTSARKKNALKFASLEHKRKFRDPMNEDSSEDEADSFVKFVQKEKPKRSRLG